VPAWKAKIQKQGNVAISHPVLAEQKKRGIQVILESLGGLIALFLEKLLIYGRKSLPQNTKRLVWTCVSYLP